MSTEQKFDLNAAKNAMKQQNAPAPREKRVYDERVFMQVERFQLSRAGGEEWAFGHAITNPSEKLAVRLSTVEERLADMPKANQDRLRQSYESGEFRRETLAEKSQGKIRLIAFDGARPLGVSEEGVKQYRAHWPQTMAKKPEAEVTAGVGSIVLYQPKEGSAQRADAYVEFLRTATAVDGSNIRQALESALSPKDDNENARDSHALMRVFYNGEEVATARVFPARVQSIVIDPVYGDERTVMVPMEGANSFDALKEGKVTGIQSMDANNDLARAVVAGLMDDENPPASNFMKPEQAENFFYGAKGGDLHVEIVGVERIKFGVDSAKTYLKDRENVKFANYLIKTEVEGQQYPTVEHGYGNTVVALQRYPNGQPYAVYASPQENFPQVSPLARFDSQMPLTSILPEDPKALKQEKSHDNSMEM